MKVLVRGQARGTVLRSSAAINFLGTVNKDTGVITDSDHPLYNRSLKDVVLVFPSGVGSSVGAYTIYSIKQNNVGPCAMLCAKADITVVTGCALANIPLIVLDKSQFDEIKSDIKININTDQSNPITCC